MRLLLLHFFLLFFSTLSQEFLVFSSSGFSGFRAAFLQSQTMSLALQSNRSDKTLDFGGFGGGFASFFLGGDFTTDNVFANIVVFGEVLVK
jgi:hypothetical protein